MKTIKIPKPDKIPLMSEFSIFQNTSFQVCQQSQEIQKNILNHINNSMIGNTPLSPQIQYFINKLIYDFWMPDNDKIGRNSYINMIIHHFLNQVYLSDIDVFDAYVNTYNKSATKLSKIRPLIDLKQLYQHYILFIQKQQQCISDLKDKIQQSQQDYLELKHRYKETSYQMNAYLLKIQKENQSLTQLQNSILDMENQYKQGKLEISDYESRIKEINLKNIKIKTDIEDLLKEFQTLELSMQQIIQQIKQEEQRFIDLKKELNAQEIVKNQLLSKIQVLSQQLGDKQKEQSALLKKIDELTQSRTKIKNTQIKQSQDISNTENQIIQVKKDIDQLNEQGQDYSSKIQDLEQKIQGLDNLKQQLNKSISDLQDEENALNLRLQKIQQDLEQALKQQSEQSKQVTDLKRQWLQLQIINEEKEMELLDQKRKQIQKEMELLQLEKLQIQKEMELLDERSKKNGLSQQEIQDKMKLKQQDLDILQKELQDLINAKKIQKNEIDTKQLEFEKLKLEVEEYKIKINMQQNQVDDLGEQLSKQQKDFNTIDLQVQDTKSQIDKLRQQIKQEQDSFGIQESDIDQVLKNTKQELSDKEKRILELQKLIQEVMQKKEELLKLQKMQKILKDKQQQSLSRYKQAQLELGFAQQQLSNVDKELELLERQAQQNQATLSNLGELQKAIGQLNQFSQIEEDIGELDTKVLEFEIERTKIVDNLHKRLKQIKTYNSGNKSVDSQIRFVEFIPELQRDGTILKSRRPDIRDINQRFVMYLINIIHIAYYKLKVQYIKLYDSVNKLIEFLNSGYLEMDQNNKSKIVNLQAYVNEMLFLLSSLQILFIKPLDDTKLSTPTISGFSLQQIINLLFAGKSSQVKKIWDLFKQDAQLRKYYRIHDIDFQENPEQATLKQFASQLLASAISIDKTQDINIKQTIEKKLRNLLKLNDSEFQSEFNVQFRLGDLSDLVTKTKFVLSNLSVEILPIESLPDIYDNISKFQYLKNDDVRASLSGFIGDVIRELSRPITESARVLQQLVASVNGQPLNQMQQLKKIQPINQDKYFNNSKFNQNAIEQFNLDEHFSNKQQNNLQTYSNTFKILTLLNQIYY